MKPKDRRDNNRNEEQDYEWSYNPKANNRKANKAEYYYCNECGQEFRRKERTCSVCGSTDIRKQER